MNKILFSACFLLALFISEFVTGQHMVLNTPGKYLMPMDNASSSFPGNKNKEGDLWVVFSDRPDNALYSDRNCTKTSGEKLDFMQAMYVVEEKENAVKLINLSDADARGNLIDGASDRARWIEKDKVLLWRNCLKTRDVNLPEFKDGIFNKKAMVLNIISGNQRGIGVPEYYSDPKCQKADSINSALVYQINYVYKETDKALLLGDVPELADVNRDKDKIKGWVLKSQTTSWNHRLAFEVNWDNDAVKERKAKGQKATITSEKQGGTTLFKEDNTYYSSRAIGEVDRFPVLDVFNGVSKVGVIGELRSEQGNTLSSGDFAHIKHVIDSMSRSMRNVNVIFVIDATSSMIPYSRAIQSSIKKTMRNLRESSNNFRFGGLLYRDASEGNSNTIHYTRDLTSNFNGVISLLGRYMTPMYNKCNDDPEEAVFYGMKKAIERFDPPAGESNFLILIGDAGNHNRTMVKDCSGREMEDKTRVAEREIVDLLVKKNISLFAYQVHHRVTQDAKPAYDAFRSQMTGILKNMAIQKGLNGVSESQILLSKKDITEVNPAAGMTGMFMKAPEGGSVHPTVLANSLDAGLLAIDDKVNHKLDGISQYLNGKIASENASELANFIENLESEGINKDKLEVVFQKNGQVYNIGYTQRFKDGMSHPVYQDVLLMSRTDLYNIKRSLERLIPTDDLSLPPNQSRAFIVYGWSEILVDILGYFPEHNESIDTLSLYTLSAILTGWGGKEKYKSIKLMDVTMPSLFSDAMLYEYLIDWCVTKGHIQSIYNGQNLLSENFFQDHMWTIFYEYLYHLSNGSVTEDPEMMPKFGRYFEKYNKEYNHFNASFRIPTGTGSGLQHYWIDSRIFPHQSTDYGGEDLIEHLYKQYKN